jgi:hypothetical protein
VHDFRIKWLEGVKEDLDRERPFFYPNHLPPPPPRNIILFTPFGFLPRLACFWITENFPKPEMGRDSELGKVDLIISMLTKATPRIPWRLSSQDRLFLPFTSSPI